MSARLKPSWRGAIVFGSIIAAIIVNVSVVTTSFEIEANTGVLHVAIPAGSDIDWKLTHAALAAEVHTALQIPTLDEFHAGWASGQVMFQFFTGIGGKSLVQVLRQEREDTSTIALVHA